jgi:hypothetical protein
MQEKEQLEAADASALRADIFVGLKLWFNR